MRLRVMTLPLLVVVAGGTLVTSRDAAPPEAREAKVTAACTGGHGHISPNSRGLRKIDHVVWTSVSPKAVSWTITPKDPKDWPWSQMSFAGTPSSPATTPQPLSTARVGEPPYEYKVLVVCEDGTTETIDPDIIIESGE